MANTVLGLSMRITASADGMRKGVEESTSLLKKLTREADNSAKGFETFRNETSGELPTSMENLGTTLGGLTQEFLDGKLTAEEYKASFKGITAEAKELTKQFEEGARLTKSLRSEEERRADELENIARLEKVGAISAQTANRARAEATGANKRAAEAATQAARQQEKAAAIIKQTLTPMERYGQEVEELDALLEDGLLTQTQYNRAVAQSQASYDKATAGANKFETANKNVKKSSMQFNELSGILGMLPGQFGGIAARVSSFASAGQGLQKLFAGGLNGAMSNIGGALAGLMNPATIAVAAFAGITVAVTALAKGLNDLQQRVLKMQIEATKLGTSFDFMQDLTIAAARTGEGIETLRVGFTALLRNIDAARKGGKSQIEAFADLGISMEDLETKTPEDLFREIGLALNDMTDPALRTAAALKTVGENGGRLQPAFRALAEATEDAVRFNARLSDLDRSQIDSMRGAFQDLSLATEGLLQSLLLPFTGMFQSISQGLAQTLSVMGRNFETIGDVLSPFLEKVGIVINFLLDLQATVSNLVGLALEPLAIRGNVVGEVFGFIGDSIHAVFVFVNDLINAARDTVRSFNEWIASGKILSDTMEYFSETFNRVTKIITQLGANIGIVAGRIVERFNALVEASPLIAAFAKVMKGAFDLIIGTLNNFIGLFTSIVDRVLSFFEYLVGVDDEIELEVPVNTEQLEQASDVATRFYDEITDAADAASKFGEEGFKAALRYQEQLEMIADLIAEGELTEEEGARGVENATKEYEKRLAVIEKTQEAEKKAAEEAQKRAAQEAEQHKKRVEKLLEEQRIREEFGGSNQRFEADKNVTALQAEIARTEELIATARSEGDAKALQALTERLAKLDQMMQREQDVASGAVAAAKEVEAALKSANSSAEKAIAKAAEVGPETQKFIEDFQATMAKLSAELKLDLIDPEQFAAAAEAARKDFDEKVKNEQKLKGLRDKLAEETAKIEKDRLESLEKRIQEPLSFSGLREDASIIFDAVSGREDPAIEEYRKQLKKLDEIKTEIRQTTIDAVEIL